MTSLVVELFLSRRFAELDLPHGRIVLFWIFHIWGLAFLHKTKLHLLSFQASLFLNGNGAGEATHMSVYIKILPGEYDALLRWPFAHTVSFTLFDQSSSPDRACNIVESFVPDPTWKNFQRPSKEPDALGFGFPRFVSHEMLKKRNFIKDDVMFLRVKVDPSKIVAV